jgi:hypothetical protein
MDRALRAHGAAALIDRLVLEVELHDVVSLTSTGLREQESR